MSASSLELSEVSVGVVSGRDLKDMVSLKEEG